MLKKDSYILGAAIAILLPSVIFGLVYGLLTAYGKVMLPGFYEKFTLLLIAINALVFRYYMVNLDKEKTGKALFFVTFLAIIIYAAYFYL